MAAKLADSKWPQRSKVKIKISSSNTAVVHWVELVCHPKMTSNTRILDLQKLMLCKMLWLLIRLKCLNATIPTGIQSAQTLQHLPGEDVHWASSSQGLVWSTLPFNTRRWPSWMTGIDNKGQRSRSICQAVVMRWYSGSISSVIPRWRSTQEYSYNTRILDLLQLMLCPMHWILIRLKYAQSYNTKWNTIRANDETPARMDVHWGSSNQGWVRWSLSFNAPWRSCWVTGSDTKGKGEGQIVKQ